MSRKTAFILLVLVIALFAVATAIKSFDNDLSDKGFPEDGTTLSIEKAKQKGVFVTAVKISPDNETVSGKTVHFVSAWIERKVKSKPFLVWWWQVESRPGYLLAVRCEPHGAIEDQGMWLVRENQGNSFGRHGTDVFDDSLDASEFAAGSAKLFLVTNWKAPRTNPITISWPSP